MQKIKLTLFLNTLLFASLGFAQIPPSTYKEEVKRAEALLRTIDKKLESERIRERSSDPLLKNSIIALNFEFQNLFPMLFDRIRNLHEDVIGWGDTDSEARLEVEQKISGRKFEAENLNTKDKLLLPKYAYLIAHGDSVANHSYGGAFFILKDSVKKRATWTTADSLALRRVTAEQAFADGTLNTFSHSNGDVNRRSLTPGRGGHPHYMEVQIWGPLNANDIGELVLPSTIVVEDFLKPYFQRILAKVMAAKIPISLMLDNGGRTDDAILKRIKYASGQYPEALELIDAKEHLRRNPPLVPEYVDKALKARLDAANQSYLKNKVLPFLDGSFFRSQCSDILL